MKKAIFCVGVCFCWMMVAKAQTKLSLQECEAIFLKNNLALIGEQFNIASSKALIEQAKLWDNPVVNAEFNAINPQNNKIFNVANGGQKAIAVQQIIYLGGKKTKEVALAKTNAALAELMFKDLLRNLKYQLRVSYFNIYYDNITFASINNQLNSLDTLIQTYNTQAKKGNIALKEVVRLQALYVALKNDHTTLANSLIEEQKKLNILLSLNNQLLPSPTPQEIEKYQRFQQFSLANLEDKALQMRVETAVADASNTLAQQNLAYQKALAIPDVTVGASYDQRGGAFMNQVNLTASMPLRLWNKNQGNIKVADIKLAQAANDKQQKQNQIRADVKAALEKYIMAQNNSKMLTGDMVNNFEAVLSGVYQNFQKRNITLIEFTDYMESYLQSLIQFNQIRKSVTQACEEINFVTNSNLF